MGLKRPATPVEVKIYEQKTCVDSVDRPVGRVRGARRMGGQRAGFASTALRPRLSGADEAAAPQAQAQLHLPEGPDAVAAEFNGGTITAQEAATEYAVISEYYRMLGMNEAEYAENAKYSVLESLVEARVLEQKARELGVFRR